MKYRICIFVLLGLLLLLWIGLCLAAYHAQCLHVGDKFVNNERTTFEVRDADPDEYVGFSIQIASSDQKIIAFTTRDRFEKLIREIEAYNCEKKK